jgi:hypothetical protein
VAFDGAGAVGQGEAGGDGGPVFAQSGGEGLQLADGAGFGLVCPGGGLAAGAVAEHVGELADQGADGGELVAAAGDPGQGGTVVAGEAARWCQDPGGHRLGCRGWRRGPGFGLAQPGGVAARRAQAAAVAAGLDLLQQAAVAVAAFLPPFAQVGQVRVKEVAPGCGGVCQQLARVRGIGVAAHGRAVQVQDGADLGQVQAAAKRGVAGPGLLRAPPFRCWRAGRCYLGRGSLIAQAQFVTGDGPLDSVGEIVQQVPPVRDLDSERGAPGRALGIAATAVPADHLHAGAGIEPGAEGLRGPLGQCPLDLLAAGRRPGGDGPDGAAAVGPCLRGVGDPPELPGR